MEKKTVLIIDAEIDFCLLMQHYFGKKNCIAEYVMNIDDGLEFIELRRPEVIVADAGISSDVKGALENKISSVENYAPSIFLINSGSSSSARSTYDQRTLLDEIKDLIKAIKDIFRF